MVLCPSELRRQFALILAPLAIYLLDLVWRMLATSLTLQELHRQFARRDDGARRVAVAVLEVHEDALADTPGGPRAEVVLHAGATLMPVTIHALAAIEE